MDRLRIILLVVVVALIAFLAGIALHSNSSPAAAAGGRRILYYHDPMHPAYKSDKPGIAPDCGMELEPVYDDDASPAGERMPVGTVLVAVDKQQLIGVQTARVEAETLRTSRRLLGRVAADERRTYRVTAAVSGWFQDVLPNSTGSLVKKDEVLATFYSPEFLGPQQSFFFALGAMDRYRESGQEPPAQIQLTRANVQQAIDNLKNLGVSDAQIEELRKTRQLTQRIELRSPASGFIVTRNVSAGLRFDRGAELYRVADLSHVWVLADLYESEAPRPHPGMPVDIIYQGRKMRGSVSDVPPQFDANTRTLKVRIEVDNPRLALRPDMFVDVALPATLGHGILVPADAVLDTGARQTVFVARGEGRFEPRSVHTGIRIGGRVEIADGLAPGEQIVVSGTFLLDSESRMRSAAAGVFGASSKDPSCGMEVDEVKARADHRTSVYRDRTYFFCSRACKEDFDKDPEKFIRKAAATAQAPHSQQRAE